MGTKYKQSGRRFSHDDRFEGPLLMVQIADISPFFANIMHRHLLQI